MIIEKIDGFTRLYANETNKITDKNKSFFSDMIYLTIHDSVDNYEEVGKEIWKHFIDDNKADFDILSERMDSGIEQISNLEDIALDTDFRLLLIELKLDENI